PTCATCHAMMDPLGFALENYDVLGTWRDVYDGAPIDARGEFADGTQFEGPAGLKAELLARKSLFVRHFVRKTLGFALARELTNDDHKVVEMIVLKLEADDYRAQTLLKEIVCSVPFRYKQNP
ncbi:MAG: DUF1585 domain-containing protein, partial [Planctomycetales bacterium]|nr:DUF1585 domain-containing protein [Planctomycetales bacterium]